MKFKKYNKLSYTNITIEDAILKDTVKGVPLVIIKASNGNSYSTFRNQWEKIGIDIEEVSQGDKFKIGFVTKQWNGKNYNNFYSMELISRAVRAKDVSNALATDPDNLSADELIDAIPF